MAKKATSPSASGPAGTYFEGQVGAHYLLSMLAGAEPRGLPGTIIDRIELQRAGEGFPLDDVIVHARDSRGDSAILEIQVKRGITFSPGDSVFKSVVNQIVEASRKPEFETTRYELAIATAKTSRKLDSSYQEVLTWARQIGDADIFDTRIERRGSASDDMRTFVHTFKSHLADAGAPNDNAAVWKLLRRLHILVFDFTASGSASEDLAKERAGRVLHADDTARVAELWSFLSDLTIRVAASGGDRDRNRLIQDLSGHSFRLSGEQSYSSVRAALAEASDHALADIGDSVGNVVLNRYQRVAQVNEALDHGRYVEIRGDAGVGKSGVLKHFAKQINAEARALVLSPARITPRGWTAMRAELGFGGTARELLVDLACSGGAILLIDNLDFFGEQERITVIDLVREAANIPGISVITTARRDFGRQEPSWLPSEALTQLGCAQPIVIDELSDSEVEELCFAAPLLAPLLSSTHPARDVARNLFRLARLADQPTDEPIPRTEVEMADQWWRTADGRLDENHRERARLLKDLASKALSNAGPFDVSDHPPGAINSLVASESLIDLGGDKVVFKHDVLREWAIYSLLNTEPSAIQHLPLGLPAPPALARAVELLGRAALEHEVDSSKWVSVLENLSGDQVHGSWRRAVLLALVRSEIAADVLARASSVLFADHARILCDLIRIVIAVEVQPAAKIFATSGVDPNMIPDSLNVPVGPSWHRLILWLLHLGDDLPVPAIPDVVDLYTNWSRGLLGQDQLTPVLLAVFCKWLMEIEAARDAENFRDLRRPFGGELDQDKLDTLESDLRTGFLLFCNRVPDLAVEYLNAVGQCHRNDRAVHSIMKFRGTLAQAAPKELADLTFSALVFEDELEPSGYGREHREPFEYLDHEFLPVSPAQGPFFELLTHAPEHGKTLVFRLVEHAISFFSRGREHGDDALTIHFSGGERHFPWFWSYNWSREGAGHYSLTSALMALEAWAHKRIETGDLFEKVIADVLEPPGAPAAYLLVAVDLLLSHWPQSREAAIPFLGCPELLSLDLDRCIHDSYEDPDIFGFKELQKEPAGLINLENLKKRPSRSCSLDRLLGYYAVYGPDEHRGELRELLQNETERLGPPTDTSDLSDPEFMAIHALNRIDPANYKEIEVELRDGTQTIAHQYEPPLSESQQQEAQITGQDKTIEINLGVLAGDPSRSSPDVAAKAVEWAKTVSDLQADAGEHEVKMRHEAIITAAMIAMRDGDAELKAKNADWAQRIFSEAFEAEEDSVHRLRNGLRFNHVAIAFVGAVHALKNGVTTYSERDLLEIVADGNPAVAHGFGVVAEVISSINRHLPPALLRCAFAASVRPTRHWDAEPEEKEASARRRLERMRQRVDAESAWLGNSGDEPAWPQFPSRQTRRRRGLRIPDGQVESEIPRSIPEAPDEYADDQAAALWLSNSRALFDIAENPWLTDIVASYAPWTVEANGAGLEAYEEISHGPGEWNDAYFDLAAYCLPGFTIDDFGGLLLSPVCSLPDRSFFDIVAPFLRSVDEVYFNDKGLAEPVARAVRATLADRMMASSGWQRMSGSQGSFIEMHIAPAIAALFFNNHTFAQSPRCYLLPKAIDKLDGFLPILETLIQSGPSLFVAMTTLNVLEVSSRPEHLAFLVETTNAWLRAYADDNEFWVDHGIGRRVCAWIEGIVRQNHTVLDDANALRGSVDRLLACLVALGVVEARQLEIELAIDRGHEA